MISEPLRVGIDVTPLLGPPSGIPAVVRGMIDSLALRDDIAVSGWVLSTRGSTPPLPAGVRCVNRRIPATIVHRAWSHATVPPGSWVTGRVDVVHGTNYVVPPGPGSVLTLQDLSPIAHPDWTGPGIARMGAVTRRAVQMGAVVHVPCRRVAEEAQHLLGVEDERLRIVHNAIDPTSGGDPSRGERLAGSNRFVLALGTTGKRKALPMLVEAMVATPTETALVVAGPIGDAESDLLEAVERSGIGTRFRRLPTVTTGQRNDLLAAATVLAFPSLYEGYGLPPLEALAAGVPVVAADVGALDELVGDEIDLIPPGNAGAFTDALEAAVRNPAAPSPLLRTRLAGFTWEVAAEGLVAAYRLAAG